MSQFLKMLLASCLGVLIAIGGLFLIGAVVAGGIAQSSNKAPRIQPNSVLHIKLDKPIPEKTNNLEIPPFSLEQEEILGLHDIVGAIERASRDDDIKGIFLDVEMAFTSGYASTATLRNAIEDFRESDKFVIGHGKFFTYPTYYLASAADEVYLDPLGYFEVKGLSAQVPYMKDFLDKIGVDFEVIYRGKYKSATEPLRRNEMSQENRYQLRQVIEDAYGEFLDDVSRDRGLNRDSLRHVIDQYKAYTPELVKQYGLVTELEYRNNVIHRIKEKIGLDEDEDIDFFDINDYVAANPAEKNFRVQDKIAVVFAEGNIIDGRGENGSVGDLKYSAILSRLAEKDDIKAVVLRVNSPGGSAIASENIWYATQKIKESGKPFIVSMGDYAASGGYYIASGADTIFAEPNTLTGSIGVFTTIPNATELLDEKLGIHFDSVKTGPYATGITPLFDMSQAEIEKYQARTDETYRTFLLRVQEGRNFPTIEAVDAISQGRVWTGQDAKDVGLVDQIGYLHDAVDAAAAMAGLEKFRIREYPVVKDPLQQLIEELTGQKSEPVVRSLEQALVPKEYSNHADLIRRMVLQPGIHARMPVVFTME